MREALLQRAHEIKAENDRLVERMLAAERAYNGDTPITCASYVAIAPSIEISWQQAFLLAALDLRQER